MCTKTNTNMHLLPSLHHSGQQANNNQQHQPNDADNAKQACELRDQAYELCRKYLSGEWNNISSDDMVFKTVR